jgi:hypothetical protein
MYQRPTWPAILLLTLTVGLTCRADEPFRYPEATAGKGELRIIAGVPVLLVGGQPEEIGRQLGFLALKPASGLRQPADGFIKANGWEKLYPLVLRRGTR